jgi:selenocysteine lyase/cysteine desulfurase
MTMTGGVARRVGDDLGVPCVDGDPSLDAAAITAASNVTGGTPPLDHKIEVAHERGVPVLVDAAQLASHQPLPIATDDRWATAARRLGASCARG